MTAPTGPDFLLAVAERASERGQPYSSEFANMVYGAFEPAGISGIPDVPAMEFPLGQLPTEMMARRPLEEHEASPVSIVLGAFEAAKDKGDAEAQIEVLRDGLTLLAKWPEYLLMTTTGHPTLAFKPTEDEPADEDGPGDTPKTDRESNLGRPKRTYNENIETGRRPESETTGGEKLREAGLPDPDAVSPERASTVAPVEGKSILGPNLAKLMSTKDVVGLRVAGLLWVANRIEDTARALEVEIQGLDDHRVEGVPEETHTLHWCPVESKNILTGPDNACPACGATLTSSANRRGRSKRRR